ncbi:MAG: hypothetical protein COZ06_01295 [Armatimonadetes bacterium CG_4_10_14_3_um_filter_66_18]|nr:hypothetical protein [Armatimonadota bacterium]OIO95081.1 MAG: hypothetical protein AUJ96_27595 [Armatimonadetes bacterium CG2_30_66_41]PIU92998.1 MAG: hypothetical protein COS65_14975 [Armatimonadetes bacterium CG06_land_8_20_14_3_00_66_21]PIX44315.1 MAG: hypothetical protein COZ57_17660 [Armatimonadetes bacterium CG_4_8_14_3_um_filter_66_20]PIY53691.1 MAG: hypothetical protein COZ06_01295 [Armatimonadetes bacterium CG_4_10_14_3_um_filter_66_18]PIZ49779.1 MAG: hypothetical protein COY42_03
MHLPQHLAACLLTLFLVGASSAARAADPDFTAWGHEIFDRIERDLRVAGTDLYAEWYRVGKKQGSDLSADWHQPAGERENDYGRFSFVWPAGFQLLALAAAARVCPDDYNGRLVKFVDALDAYWEVGDNGVGGYQVLSMPSERFYDDNAWLALGLLETHGVTGEQKYLTRAEKVMEFLLEGERRTKGGGIRQRENEETESVVCTTAPATEVALKLYQLTGTKEYLAAAERWYAWLNAPEVGVRDPETNLFHQGAAVAEGDWTVKKGYRAYQTAAPIRAAVLLYQIKHDRNYLEDAQTLAAACLNKWVAPAGAFGDTGQWGGSDLVDAFLDLHAADGDRRWLDAARRMCAYQREFGRDKNGRHGEYWNVDRREMVLDEVKLLYIAPVARAFWRVAEWQKKGGSADGR